MANSILICFRSVVSRGTTGGRGTKIFSSSGFGGVGNRFRTGGVGIRSTLLEGDFDLDELDDELDDDDEPDDEDEDDEEDDDDDDDDERDEELDEELELDDERPSRSFRRVEDFD